ncbi:MAG: DUF6572 domain-containing protein [Verrucomicrobiota bacterium]
MKARCEHRPKVVDFAGVRRADSRCVLTLSDHLRWDDPDQVSQLQDKLNEYLAFIESGEIYQTYPDAREREIEIQDVCKHLPTEGDGIPFIEHASEEIRRAGIHFAVRSLSEMEREVV